MSAKVINLAERIATDRSARNFLATLKASPEIHDVLSIAIPQMAPNEQKALIAVVAFRMMGAMLPASIELISRLPMFEGIKTENIGIAFDFLVTNGVLEVVTPEGGSESAFYWPSLEQLYVRALENADRPTLLGSDGNRL